MTPKGWTGPAEVDGKKTEGVLACPTRSRSPGLAEKPDHLRQLEVMDAELSPGGAVRRRSAASEAT